MIKSKKLKKFKKIQSIFFNSTGGVSKNIYKSLNCGIGSNDKKRNVLKNLKIVHKKAGIKKNNLVINKQVHSNRIYFVDKIPSTKLIGDGLITNVKGLGLGILTADCAPIFFYDPKNNIIGAAHAGWRGAFKKIVNKMVLKFLKMGSKIKNLYVVIGPCISQKNYEVKINFKNQFLRQNRNNNKYFKLKNNKIFFDLGGYILGQLKFLKIKNVEMLKKDTFDNKNKFFSSRRSFKRKIDDYGRNISIIMIK